MLPLLRMTLYSKSMAAFTILGTSRLAGEANCSSCGAGATLSFSWVFAQERRRPEDAERLASIIKWQSLRRGWLYRCHACHEVWHLDGGGQTMTHVNSAKLPIVFEWDREPIRLADELEARLEQIGPTPPDVYGNGNDKRVTPCKVSTITGEQVDPAIVCVQLDAPVQDHMHFRLGREIADIQDSEFTLPLEVRLASSRAEEMRMGFSPSLIEMPDGKRYVLNGRTSFMAEPGYSASDAQVAEGSFFDEDPIPAFLRSPDVTFFIVDGEPGWESQQSSQKQPTQRRSWLRRLLSR